jgi:hypothetical protein
LTPLPPPPATRPTGRRRAAKSPGENSVALSVAFTVEGERERRVVSYPYHDEFLKLKDLVGMKIPRSTIYYLLYMLQ